MNKVELLMRQARRLALPKTQKAVLTCLVSYSNKNGDGTQIFPSLEIIAIECSCTIRHAQRCLRWLEAEGWIVTNYRRGGRGKPSSYNLSLNQFGALEARPPARIEPPEMEPARRLNFARGVLRRLKPDSPARERWQQEINELEAALVLGEGSQPQPQRNLPARTGSQALTLLSDTDFHHLENLYFDSVAAQAREARASPEWNKWQPFIAELRDQYNAALQARGIEASDGHSPPMDEELEAQIQDDQRAQWDEQRRLEALVEERTKKRDALQPGTAGWRMWNSLRTQAINTLKSLFTEKQEGYVT